MPAAYCRGGDRRGNRRRVSRTGRSGTPRQPGFAALVNSATPTAGIALGAIAAGALVQYGPVPLRLVYALILADFVALTSPCWPYPSPGREQGT
jgi:predicted MFS family arabinose efflux permease